MCGEARVWLGGTSGCHSGSGPALRVGLDGPATLGLTSRHLPSSPNKENPGKFISVGWFMGGGRGQKL